MSPLPLHRPQQLSLGKLEAEILNIIWDIGSARVSPVAKDITVKDIHDRILSDPDRELAYASVMTVLNRLAKKGWLTSRKQGKVLYWEALVSRAEAQALQAYDQLHRFLAVGDADIVAAFADSLDRTSLDRLDAIAQKLKDIRDKGEGK
jgi:predicted transcriptional regulator